MEDEKKNVFGSLGMVKNILTGKGLGNGALVAILFSNFVNATSIDENSMAIEGNSIAIEETRAVEEEHYQQMLSILEDVLEQMNFVTGNTLALNTSVVVNEGNKILNGDFDDIKEENVVTYATDFCRVDNDGNFVKVEVRAEASCIRLKEWYRVHY